MPLLKLQSKKFCLLALTLILIGCDSKETKDNNPSDQTPPVQHASPIEANMNEFRVMLETYAFDWYYTDKSNTFKPRYPDSIASLKQEAQNNNNDYWKTLTNPVSKSENSLLDFSAYEAGDKSKGLVLYAPIKEHNEIITYLIYATDDKGQLIQKDGFPLTLTNS